MIREAAIISLPRNLQAVFIGQTIVCRIKMDKDQDKHNFMVDWEELKAKNKLEDNRARKIMEEVEQTQKRAQETQNNIANTLRGVRSTIDTIQTTTQMINRFQMDFGNVLVKLAEKVSSAFCEQVDSGPGIKPVVIPISDIVEKIIKKNKVVFLMGSGLPALGGTSTFRGEGGHQNKVIVNSEKEPIEAKNILVAKLNEQHPSLTQKAHLQCRQVAPKSNPDQRHVLVDKVCNYLVDMGIQVYLFTQTPDNHAIRKPNYQTYHTHEGQYTRYDEKMNQASLKHCGGDILDSKCDMVVVIDTWLQSNFTTKLILQAQQVVEINPNPVLETGRVFTIRQTVEEGLRSLYQELTK